MMGMVCLDGGGLKYTQFIKRVVLDVHVSQSIHKSENNKPPREQEIGRCICSMLVRRF